MDASSTKKFAAAANAVHTLYFFGQPQRHRRKIAAHRGRSGRIYSQAIFSEGSGAQREESGRPAAAGETAEAPGSARRDSRAAGRDVDHGFDAIAGNGAEELPADHPPRR